MPKIDSNKLIEAFGTQPFMYTYVDKTDCNTVTFLAHHVFSVKGLVAACEVLGWDPDDVLINGHEVSFHNKDFTRGKLKIDWNREAQIERVVVAGALKVV